LAVVDPRGTVLGGGEVKIHTSNQTAAGGPGRAPGNGPVLTAEKLQPLLTEAIARWQEAGATAEQVRPLLHLPIQIVPLPPGRLAMTGPGIIWSSPNAAGYGWFIDPNPADDAAFNGAPDSPAQNRMDLLSVLAHELGHIVLNMGESTAPDDVMTEALPAGVRQMPTPLDLGLTPSAAWVSSHNALGLKNTVGENGVSPVVPADGRMSLSALDDFFVSGPGTPDTSALPEDAQVAVVRFEPSGASSAAAAERLLTVNGAGTGPVPREILDKRALTGSGTDPLGDNRLDDVIREVVG
jgi:hypothetical protein